jgi:hypothetical protein
MPCLHREVSRKFHLLIHFGYELGEAIPSEIYQGHRNTNSWAWQPLASPDPAYITLCRCGHGLHVLVG